MQHFYTVFDMDTMRIGLGPQNPKNFIYENGGFDDGEDSDGSNGVWTLIFFLLLIVGISVAIYFYMRKKEENPTFKKLDTKK